MSLKKKTIKGSAGSFASQCGKQACLADRQVSQIVITMILASF